MTGGSPLAVQVRMPLDRFALDVGFETEVHVTGVFGASGSGKSSLLRSVAGLERRATGHVSLGGETWLDSDAGRYMPPERRRIGYVPQDGLLFPHHDVRRNLLAGAGRARHSGWPVEETFELLCDLLELESLLDRDVESLSGGERQRVALGRAICSGPQLLLLDEPLASLDLPLRRKVLPFLRRVRSEFRIPMLMVSHEPTEIQALCDELIVLREGSVIAQGGVRALLTDPEVLPLVEGERFENVLPTTLLSSADGTSEVRLGTADNGVRLTVPRVSGAPGDEVLLGILAREVLLAVREPIGLSARNVVPATVLGVADSGQRRLVTAAVAGGAAELTAVLTATACEELELGPGTEVFLVIKTSGCHLYQ